MTYKIALNFEDGVTRFITCNENEARRAHRIVRVFDGQLVA